MGYGLWGRGVYWKGAFIGCFTVPYFKRTAHRQWSTACHQGWHTPFTAAEICCTVQERLYPGYFSADYSAFGARTKFLEVVPEKVSHLSVPRPKYLWKGATCPLRPPYPINKAYQLPHIQWCFIAMCVCIKPSQTHGHISRWTTLPVTAWNGKLSCLLWAISHNICTTIRYQPASWRARFLVLNLIRFAVIWQSTKGQKYNRTQMSWPGRLRQDA